MSRYIYEIVPKESGSGTHVEVFVNPVYLGAGIGILVLTIVDLLWTTLWVDGSSGPVSTRVTTWIWRGLRAVGGMRSRTLSLAGPLILISILVMWILSIWAGWTLIFAGGRNSLMYTRGPGPVTWVGRIYFVAYTMFTMGNGDYAPVGAVWQIATSLTTASGMLVVTLAVSYVVSVLSAVVDKRSFAASTTGIGERSEEFVKAGWNDEDTDLHELDLPLDSLASQLGTLAQQHRAYPILHYYHSEQAHESSAVAVAILDEALTIIRFGIDQETTCNEPLVDATRSSVEGYLETVGSAYIQPAEQAPRPPDLDRLRDADLPTVSDREFDRSLDELEDRRRSLLGIVEADAWHWPPIHEQ